MNTRLRLPLALALALGSGSACALGLGQIEVKSALNQPLAAEIPVISNQYGEADELVVRLAPPEALARVGLEAPTGVAANLEFSIDTRDDGSKVIRVTTPGKVNDPFVSFLLEVDWGKGKMLREYTVLLDPPTMAPVRSAAVTAPVAEVPAQVEPLPEAPPPPPMTETPAETPAVAAAEVEPPPAEPMPEPAPPEPEPEPQPEPEPVAEAPAPMPEPVPEAARERVDTYGPVASGETLWSIAQFARPDDSVSMNQMMLALLYANPDAFIDQNINRLKKGAILRIPSREEALTTAAVDAAAQVAQQMQSWRQTTPSVQQPAEPQPDDSPSAPLASAPPRPADSRLELVPPRDGEGATGAQSGASVAGQGAELRAELARSQEESASLSRENVELKSRVSELEKMSADSQRLLELKDSELKAAQDALARVQAQADAPVSDAAPSPDAAAPDGAVLDGASPETAADPMASADAPASEDAAMPDDSATDVAATEAPDAGTEGASEPAAPSVTSTDTTAAAADPASAAAEPLPERPAPTPWFKNMYVLGGAGLVLLGLGALVLSRRRKPASAAAPSAASAARYAGAVPSTASAAPAPADRGAQLAEAVARDPGNLNRHLELVRYHYEEGDAASFEQAAEAMYSRVYDPENLAWKQVVAMGHELAPEHPLFVQPEVAAPIATPAPAPVAKPVVPAKPAPAPAPAAAPIAAAAAPVAAARNVDWGRSAAPADSGTTQQMKLDDVRPAAPAAAKAPEPKFEPSFEPVPEFDLGQDFGNDLGGDVKAPQREPTPPPAGDGGGFVDADAASTKLELARAYLDMGDVEGARGMLEEVVGEGNPGQRAEAKRLLDEIR